VGRWLLICVAVAQFLYPNGAEGVFKLVERAVVHEAATTSYGAATDQMSGHFDAAVTKLRRM